MTRHGTRASLAVAAVALFAVCALAVITLVGGPATPSVAVINGSVTYQTISGFGASEAFGQADVIMNAPRMVQLQALKLLFSTTTGAGLTIVRNEIPSDSAHTIEPSAPASPSAIPTYVPLDSDWGQEWFSKQAERYGIRQFFADAYSAPAFMKTNDSDTNGGTLCGVPGTTCASGDWRQAYANYLVQYARDYEADGIPLRYIGFENEANLAPSYPSMVIDPAQTANFADVFGPTLARSGLPTQLECCATEGWNYASQYASAIEADPVASSSVKLFTSHGYTAAPDSPLPGWQKPVWETEWSTFQTWDPAWDDGTAASGFTWAQHIYTALTAANVRAFLYWWGSSSPTTKGDNESLIQINGSTVSASSRLWAFANFSRSVRPGAARIGAATSDINLELTAFRNVNGSLAIVALNTGRGADLVKFSLQHLRVPGAVLATPYVTDSSSDTAAQARIPVREGNFSAKLPARSLVTFDIR
jgi:O-glycosyl hydrolase